MNDFDEQEFLNSQLATGEELEPWCFPELYTLSAAFFFQLMPVARAPEPPEVVFVPSKGPGDHELVGLLAYWNHLWESGQYRDELFTHSRMATEYRKVAPWIDRLVGTNAYLVANSRTQYDAYAPLYHLLPKRLLDRYGLPALKRSVWPGNSVYWWNEKILPGDFVKRLGSALSEHIWPYLNSGSGRRAFAPSDPLLVLSHSLDYWLPYCLKVIDEIRLEFPRVEPESPKQRRIIEEARRDPDPEVEIERPRKGGTLWMGEEEASRVTDRIIATADESGKLRGIIDAVRSNRVSDDFSDRWSYAREDFERKLYAKRSKSRVTFVELDDTIPVHNSQTEYTDGLIWQDFFALLDKRERKIVVCLRNGTTKLGDIASALGYANHSPVSKALARIRRKAAALLDLYD